MMATAAVNGIEDALQHCGVTERTLAVREKESLDRHGYVVLAGVMDDDWLAEVRIAFEAAVAAGGRHGAHVHLLWDDPAFDGIYSQPRVLAAVYHVLRRAFRTFPPVGRDPLPGHGQQGLHPDWGRAANQPYHVVTVLWLLDDFTPTNGATRVIPGSHKVPRPVPKAMLNPDRRHPDQSVVVAEAGSALVFNAHLLHGGTRNQSAQRRRVLQCQYRGREEVMPLEGRVQPPGRLSAAARYILGEDAAGGVV